MKKRIGLLLLCALLSGCANNNSKTSSEDTNANVVRTTFLLNYSFAQIGMGETLELSPLTYETVDFLTWVSSDPLVASVENGIVTPVNYGTVTISAFDSLSIGTCSITVKEQEISIDFEINPTNIVLNVGDSNSVKPTLTKNGEECPASGVQVVLKEESTSEVASFVKDEEYYVFTGVNSGTTIYSFTISSDDLFFGANLFIKVN